MKTLIAFISGLIFGLGLILSGMTNPAKVIGFLDLAGNWDPSLALVMGGAIFVAFPAFQIAKKQGFSLIGDPIQLSSKTSIDPKLVYGSLIFGIGWGLSGYCPGPAVASLISGGLQPVVFVITMLAGISLYKPLQKLQLKIHRNQGRKRRSRL